MTPVPTQFPNWPINEADLVGPWVRIHPLVAPLGTGSQRAYSMTGVDLGNGKALVCWGEQTGFTSPPRPGVVSLWLAEVNVDSLLAGDGSVTSGRQVMVSSPLSFGFNSERAVVTGSLQVGPDGALWLAVCSIPDWAVYTFPDPDFQACPANARFGIRVWRSVDGGATWSYISEMMFASIAAQSYQGGDAYVAGELIEFGGRWLWLAPSPITPLAGTRGLRLGLGLSIDGGISWAQVYDVGHSTRAGNVQRNFGYTGLLILDETGDTASASGQLHRSSPNGTTWSVYQQTTAYPQWTMLPVVGKVYRVHPQGPAGGGSVYSTSVTQPQEADWTQIANHNLSGTSLMATLIGDQIVMWGRAHLVHNGQRVPYFYRFPAALCAPPPRFVPPHYVVDTPEKWKDNWLAVERWFSSFTKRAYGKKGWDACQPRFIFDPSPEAEIHNWRETERLVNNPDCVCKARRQGPLFRIVEERDVSLEGMRDRWLWLERWVDVLRGRK